MRTIFLGTGEIGLPALRWLLESPHGQVIAVYTQPDRPSGRHMELTPPAVKVLALERGVPVHQPENLRDPAAWEELNALAPELIVVMAYGQILSKKVISLPTVACLNLHASILPKHRGASPIQGAILAGDAMSGVTVMHVAPGLDTGDMILAETCPIEPEETGGTLHDKLAEVAPKALARALDLLVAGKAPRTPQDSALATYHGKLEREDGKIDWTQSAVEIERLIRAYDPWPGTFTYLDGKKLKIYPPTPILEASGAPGTVIPTEGEQLVIACGQGALALREVQLEGRKRLPVSAFLTGQGTVAKVGE